MRNLLHLAVVATIATPVIAQPDHFTSSPAGYESTEGSLSVDLIGKEALLRFQQIDATNWGSKADRNRIAFRRDGLMPFDPNYVARTLDMELVMGEGDLATATSNFDGNYTAGTKTVVISRKRVSFPDWQAAPALAPQSESNWAILWLDSQWSYLGKQATGTDLVWEVRVWANDQAGKSYPMDADPVVLSVMQGATGSTGNSSCVTTGQTRGMNNHVEFFNHGTKMSSAFDISRAAPNSPATMLLGTTAQSIAIGGLCSTLELIPVTDVFMGNTDGTGFAFLSIDPIAYNTSLIGQSFYSQAVALDNTQPGGIGLGVGRKTYVPIDPSTNSQCVHLYSLDPNAASASSGVLDGGLILHTNHP